MIEGKKFADAIISGANHLSNHRQEVDELNVFPVPDGDTGTNMTMTISAGKRELELLENPTIEKVTDTAASALLRGARGNSGVILSLLFRGISKGMKGKTSADGQDIAAAWMLGVEAAYKAVMKPTEGTILTVAREAGEAANALALETNEPEIIFDEMVRAATSALQKTPELLPVLKKAGVVDAGGQGLLYILEGMRQVIKNDKIIPSQKELTEKAKTAPQISAVANTNSEITFGYCTEYIVEKAENCPDALKLRAFLESIGDSVVCVDDDSIIKVHVHTDHPGNAIEEGLKFGVLNNLKVDNMRIQHQNKIIEAERKIEDEGYAAVNPDKPFGFVAVAAGAGIQALFSDLGVDHIVSGGQTMNPSTDDILRAIQATPAATVFVLPNNKNIIMAAEQAVRLADRRVCVLQTRTIPQGISAMLAFDAEKSYSENRLAMTKQFDMVQTGLITFAARNSEFDGRSIKKGEILALDNGKLSFTDKDTDHAILRLFRQLTRKKGSSFMTIIYGADVTDEQAGKVEELVKEKYGNNYEISLINGGQPVYYYILSVE